MVNAEDSKPSAARLESSSLSPGTKREARMVGEYPACAGYVRDLNAGAMIRQQTNPRGKAMKILE